MCLAGQQTRLSNEKEGRLGWEAESGAWRFCAVTQVLIRGWAADIDRLITIMVHTFFGFQYAHAHISLSSPLMKGAIGDLRATWNAEELLWRSQSCPRR